MNVLQILETIGADSKRGHKLSVFEQNKNNQDFLKVVKLALDPYTNFYIKQIPKYESTENKSLEWALDELEKLSSRQLTGHAGIDHLRTILSNLSSDNSIVIERIIGKDLRCNMAEGIVNAVIDKFIPSYPCLLARSYDDKNIKHIKFPAYSQLKADGLRANVHVNGSQIMICGRSGRAIDLLGNLDAAMFDLAKQFPWPVVFDGEFVVVDENGLMLNRKTGNGIITKAIKGTISDKEAKSIRFQLWDAIPMDEFKNGESTESYKIRFDRLLKAIDDTNQSSPVYWSIPYKVVATLDEAIEHFQSLLAAGHEGTILKNYHGIWEDSRSKHLIKMKAELEMDLEVIGWVEGTGKYQGKLGALTCKNQDGTILVSVGSGYSDEERSSIDKGVIGKIVSVMYNEIIEDKKSSIKSLFLPRFVEIRSDKTQSD